MEIRDYLKILRKRGWIIIVLALLAAGLAFAISQVQTPTYKAKVSVSVLPARPDWGLGSTAKELLRNFAVNIKTHKTARQVIDRAQLDMSTYDLLSKVEVNPVGDQFLIEIAAEDQEPAVAVTIAMAFANQFIDERNAYYQQQDKADRIEVKLVDDVIDAPLFKPKPLLNAIAGLVLGALLGLLIVFALEWLEADILRTPAAVERSLGVAVLGTIPAEASQPARSGKRSQKAAPSPAA
ncbi:MAG TPA: Wzz/FepE/Etk N-terminal domain-containing protein [Anaerolineae bacterium]|nr:Wzz/FepE/Etk N-terminal domain-containing protein [Anaerolineae bacterium]HNU02554.1 Wzz/FepE/Etk N-terminal domain-containing protein [Anaerolineae bacterium]